MHTKNINNNTYLLAILCFSTTRIQNYDTVSEVEIQIF